MRNGMNKDFSWNASAREYVRVYERARQVRAAQNPVLTASVG
jgi:glycogen synthase